MSYVIHIWEHHEPLFLIGDFNRVSEWFTLLSRVKGEPSAKFPLLAKRLREIFSDDPAEDDDGDGDFDSDSVWLEEPPKAGKDRVWALGLNSGQLHRSMPVIVREALKLRLLVYDFQTGNAYLPNGNILGKQMTFQGHAAEVSSTDDGQVDATQQFERKSELVAVFVEMMEPILKPHGFKFVKSKHAFVKTYPQIEQHLSFEF